MDFLVITFPFLMATISQGIEIMKANEILWQYLYVYKEITSRVNLINT